MAKSKKAKLRKVATKLGVDLYETPTPEPTNLELLEKSCLNAAKRVEERNIRSMEQAIRHQLDAAPGEEEIVTNRDYMIQKAVQLAKAGELEALRIFLDFELPKNVAPQFPQQGPAIIQFIGSTPTDAKQLKDSGHEVEFLEGEVVS